MLVRQRLVVAFVTMGLVFLVGTVGLVVIEGWPPFDAFYMVVTTVTTVGFGEIRPLTTSGRAFILVLILAGVGTMLYALTTLAETLIEYQIAPGRVLARRQRHRVRKMRDHVIVCGYGRVGAQVAAELAREGVAVVVVDVDPAVVERAAAEGLAGVAGDAATDEVLTTAGIAAARGLVATTNSDANNVYVTLAARALRPELYIVARVDRDEAASRLRTAGADRVISPYHLGGRRMASLVVRPSVVDFVDTLLQSPRGPLRMEEVQVREGAPLAGLSIGDARRELGIDVTVLALVKPGGDVLASPPPTTSISAGDVLIVLGRLDMLALLEKNCGAPATRRS